MALTRSRTHHQSPTLGIAGKPAAEPLAVARLGRGLAVTTGLLTVVSFGLALTALPDKVPYPFTADVITEQWPGDYLWMYPAMLAMVAFVALLAVVHQTARAESKAYSLIGLVLGAMAAAILLVDYFLQASVMQVSLEKAQLDGWSMLTQYNPNGVFIALEELGYLLMSLALLALVPVFGSATRAERVLRVLLPLSSAGVLAALTVVSAARGIDRGDVFEIAVITIVWTTLILFSGLLAVVFHRALSRPQEGPPSESIR
jgi:hypothetical protein